MLSVTEIKECKDIELLEKEQSVTYQDCADINNCLECSHKNKNEVCDLDLLTRRLHELS